MKKLKNTLKWRFYNMAGSKSSLLIDSPIMCKGKELAFVKEWLTSEAEGCKTELNNICACAKIQFCHLSMLIFFSFHVLFVWCLPRYGLELNRFTLIVKFTYRNNNKYSTWHVNWCGRSYLWWFAKLEYVWNNTRWVSLLSVNPMHFSSYVEQISILRWNDMTAK